MIGANILFSAFRNLAAFGAHSVACHASVANRCLSAIPGPRSYIKRWIPGPTPQDAFYITNTGGEPRVKLGVRRPEMWAQFTCFLRLGVSGASFIRITEKEF
jgi:hypothetical protein